MNRNRYRAIPTNSVSASGAPFFTPTGDLLTDIRHLSGSDVSVSFPTLDASMSGQVLRVCGTAISHDETGKHLVATNSQEAIERFIIGLHAAGLPLLFALIGEGNTVGVYLTIAGNSTALSRQSIIGAFPGIILESTSSANLVASLRGLRYCAAIRGMPADRGNDEGLDGILRGLQGCRWAYVVAARPIHPSLVTTAMETLAAEMQRTRNTYLRPLTCEHGNHPLAEHYIKLLEAAFNHYHTGSINGCWESRTFLFTGTHEMLARGSALLVSAIGGDESLPCPVRAYHCLPSTDRTVHGVVLNSRQMSHLVRFPRHEAPGFQLRPVAQFAAAMLPGNVHCKSIAVGRVVHMERLTGDWLEVGLDSLAKHALITGVTGSGKTQTCQFILDQVWREHGVPYLVIEPAKREYRALQHARDHGNLKVFTPGNEAENPLRLNPFEVPSGIHVQTHIDHLRSLFSATFAGLYPPMPYIMEEAFYRLYSKAGWNMVTGKRSGDGEQPTLTDYCMEVDDIVLTSGYDTETTQNIATALRIRLNSLRVGTKGLMLNTARSVTEAEMFGCPAVLELSSIGDAEVVAFIMGLVMIRLHEHICNNEPTGSLKHITVIEEAHRLLPAGMRDSGNVDVSSIRVQAVESMCNMLAEVRAYGEGIVIVDQSPVKLHPDATKGTGLKIAHRLVAEDDRRAIAGSTGMNWLQAGHLAILETGQAAAFTEGIHQPYLVSVPQFGKYAIIETKGGMSNHVS